MSADSNPTSVLRQRRGWESGPSRLAARLRDGVPGRLLAGQPAELSGWSVDPEHR